MDTKKGKSLKAIKNTQEQLLLQKRTAEAENKAKSEFIINIIHDIRSPLTGITGLASHLAEKTDSPKEKEYARIIHEGSKQLLDLLNDVIDSKEFVKQDRKVTKEPFHLTEIIEKIKELEEPSVVEKNLKLKVDVDPKIPAKLISDKLKLKRILLNLVSNAVKFTTKGHIKIEIKLLSESNDKAQIEFSVSDTGIGIPHNEQSKVFKRYYKKVNFSETTNYSSSGLGLDIVQKYVRLLGGKIVLKSTVGEGTTFSFVLPMGVSHQVSKETTGSMPLTQEGVDGKLFDKGLKILLVEDNYITLTSLKLMMDKIGINPKIAVDFDTAINAIHKQPFDIIITDIELPDGSGYSLCEQIRSLEKQQGKAPVTIIGLTGHAIGEITKRCKEAGMNDVYQKPLDLKRLTILVTEVAQNRSVEFEKWITR